MNSALKKCSTCKQFKPLDEFAIKRGNKQDGRCCYCKPCKSNYNRTHYLRNPEYYAAKRYRHNTEVRDRIKKIIDDLKSEPCADCGKTFHPCVMDFDHVRGEKLDKVSSLMRESHGFERTLTILRAEIAKCDVVCANCHRLRTFQRISKVRSGVG